MKKSILNEYKRLRKAGWVAHWALSHANTMDSFRTLESCRLVRFQWVPDELATIEDLEGQSFCPQANPDVRESVLKRQRDKFIEQVDRDGVWGLVGEYSTNNGETWEHGSSVWGFVGWDAGGYESDIAQETIEALRSALKKRCPKCRTSAA